MKRCSVPGCVNYSFSHSFCARHQNLRTDPKKPQRTIKKQSEPRTVSIPTFGFDDQETMFEWMWEEEAKKHAGIVVCPYTDETLNHLRFTEMYYSCFAHILPKGRYTYWKLNPTNMRIVNPLFHIIVDRGTNDDRAEHPSWRWDIWDAERELLKQQYEIFKVKNFLR